MQHCHQDCVDLPDEAKEEVEEDGEGEEDNKDCNAEESHGGQGDANDGPYMMMVVMPMLRNNNHKKVSSSDFLGYKLWAE